MSYGFSAFIAGLFQKCDLIIGTSPQLFTAIAAKRLSGIKRTPWIMEVRDLWPESIKILGAVKDGLAIRFFEGHEKKCYKRSEKIICATDGIRERLLQRGIEKDKVQVFTNGANLENYVACEKDQQLLKDLGLENKVIVGYIGTMGMAHKLDFILQSARKVKNPNIHFLIIGEGAEKENLLKLKKDLNLKNVTILNGIPKKDVKRHIASIDIALVNLKRSDLFLGALPSKIFENAAMKKPILLGLKGEAEKVISKYNAGLSYEPENEDDFLARLEELSTNKDLYKRCVEGCSKLAQDYDRKKIASEMLKSIIQLSG
jgi:glycosyltransferase involved in cell wall biosynthesis